jgi:hypothetical protein
MNFSLLKYNLSFIFSFSLFAFLIHPFVFKAQENYTILHIGDSHLQPNNLSGMTRYHLQKDFGNAGRGLIFPYSLAQTNGPKDFVFKSTITWTSSWITKPSAQAIGLTGISIKSKAKVGKITWVTGKDSLDYPAQKGFVFYEIEGCLNCKVSVNGSTRAYTTAHKFTDTLSFSINQDTSLLEFSGGTFTLLDLAEHAKKPGIVYHSTGVAGATFKSYNDNPNFSQGLSILRPDLVIVSLGTNESVKKWDSLAFQKEVNFMLDRIIQTLPKAKIVLVLPNENYLKVNGTFVYNSRTDNVRSVLEYIATARQLQCYDQQKAMGGKGCMLEWQKQGLVNEDHIHFLRKGYHKQGLLLASFLKPLLQEELK